MHKCKISTHLLTHNITEVDYYHNILGNPRPSVNECGKYPPFYSIDRGYGSFCGKSPTCLCSSKSLGSRLNKIKIDNHQAVVESNRKKLAIINSDPELRRKSELANAKARRESESYINYRSEFMSEQWNNGVFSTPEMCADRSKRMTDRNLSNWADSEYRERTSRQISESHTTPEYLENLRKFRYQWNEHNGVNFRSYWESEFAKKIRS